MAGTPADGEGHERHPEMAPDEWGDPGAAADAAARELDRQMTAEERAAGDDAW